MAVGLKIINTHGTILIDDTSPCLQLRGKYTLNVRSGAAPGIDSINIPNVVSPLFALRPKTINKRVYLSTISATGTPTTKLLQVRQTSGVGWDESSSVDVDIYHFDKPVAPASTSGIHVYDAAGNCMFDAMGKTAVVVGVANTSGVATTITPPSGRVYAYASPAPFNRYYREYEEGLLYNNHYANIGAILSGGQVWMQPAGNSVFGTEPSPGEPDLDITYSGTPYMLAIDVTTY